MDRPVVESPPRTRRGGVARSGALLLSGTLIANVLSYVFFIILSRHLSEDSLGAVGAMVNLSAIAVVPALGLQLVAAREVSQRLSRGPRDGPPLDRAEAGLQRDIIRLGLELGAGAAALIAVSSPLLAALFHVDVPTLLVLAASMLPLGLTFAAQGLLQGSERFVALATVLASSGVGKLAAALVAAALGGDVLVVVACLTAGWVLTGAIALMALGSGVTRTPAPRHPSVLRTMVTAAAVPTSGLLVLSSLDVLLARAHLTPADSGAYTVGALFEKAAFWGMAFIATLFYPAMARVAESRRATARALGVTAGVGTLGVLVTALVPQPLVLAAGGPTYAALAPVLWRFTLLGVLLALVQVLVFSRLAQSDARAGIAVWVGAVAAVVTMELTTRGRDAADVVDVVTVMLVCSAVLTVVLLVHSARTSRVGRR